MKKIAQQNNTKIIKWWMGYLKIKKSKNKVQPELPYNYLLTLILNQKEVFSGWKYLHEKKNQEKKLNIQPSWNQQQIVFLMIAF